MKILKSFQQWMTGYAGTSTESDYQEALAFTIDSIKSALLVLTDRLDEVEGHLTRERPPFRAADTDYIGAEFQKKWAHMLKDEK